MNRALLFDMDGTIFQTDSIVLTSFQMTFAELKRLGHHNGPLPSDNEFLSTLGKIIPEIWQQLLPDQTPQVRQLASHLMGDIENKLLGDGQGHLYPDVKDVLARLKQKGWQLYVASNGTQSYIESVAYYTGIKDLFNGFYSSGGRKTNTKSELVQIILHEKMIEPTASAMVGDRHHDVQAGLDANLKTIGCRFGYGQLQELNRADIIITSFKEIENALVTLGLST